MRDSFHAEAVFMSYILVCSNSEYFPDSAGNVLRADYLSGCRSNSSCSGSNYLFQLVHGYKSGFRNAGG